MIELVIRKNSLFLFILINLINLNQLGNRDLLILDFEQFL